MYQVIYGISINMYRYEYRIKKTDRYSAQTFGALGDMQINQALQI